MFDRRSISVEKLRLGVRSLFPSLEHGPAPSRTSKTPPLRQDKQIVYLVLSHGTLSVFLDYDRATRYALLASAVLTDTGEQALATMYSVTCRCEWCIHYYHDLAMGHKRPHKPGKQCRVRPIAYRL
jgi:hypothetical protein